jgi:hypothetical protein
MFEFLVFEVCEISKFLKYWEKKFWIIESVKCEDSEIWKDED